MASLTGNDDLRSAELDDVDLSDARFVGCDLSRVVMRGVVVEAMQIDAPWLSDGETFLLVNDVDVIPLVEAELDRRFPGRSLRRAADPEGLRMAWTALEECWRPVLDRAAAQPEGTVDVSVDGEWSFAQTLRHVVLATDMWLAKAVLGLERPYHRFGLVDVSAEQEGFDMSVFALEEPTYDEVLAARASRVELMADFLAGVTPEVLAEPRPHPHDPTEPETVLGCLHVVLEESWEHLRYAVRDLAAIEAGRADA
jgi:hypothetical protein